LTRGPEALVEQASPTARAIAALLKPLEASAHIHVFFDQEKLTLRAELPRLKLDFYMQTGETALHCKQFRGMVVDPDQDAGTLTGLMSKLVLINPGNRSRNILIPSGDVSWSRVESHVSVTICCGSGARIPYYCYQVDEQLGRLVDNGSLSGKLFQAYLHALTSHCLPDKLTGLTGTEQALAILSSAATLSHTEFSKTDIELLENIAILTPQRKYYPKHLRVMQETKWSSLPSLSQHHLFFTLAASLYESVSRLASLRVTGRKLEPFATANRDLHLLDKASIRNAYCYVDGFGARNCSTLDDVMYPARDIPSNEARVARTFRTATLVDEWSNRLDVSKDLMGYIKGWNQPISGARSSSPPVLELGYNTEWLDPPCSVFPRRFMDICKALSSSTKEEDKYKIMFFLSTLSYSKEANQQFVESLLVFAMEEEWKSWAPPAQRIFYLDDGFVPQRQELVDTIEESFAKDFSDCPESRITHIPGETLQQHSNRRRDAFRTAGDEAISQFVDTLIAQWPTSELRCPENPALSIYINVNEAVDTIGPRFSRWYDNRQFESFIRKAQASLGRVMPFCLDIDEYCFNPPPSTYVPPRSFIKLEDMFSRDAPVMPLDGVSLAAWLERTAEAENGSPDLDRLVMCLSQEARAEYERTYAADLLSSFKSLRNAAGDPQFAVNMPAGERRGMLEWYATRCQKQVNSRLLATPFVNSQS
jgi:hypothetical protein